MCVVCDKVGFLIDSMEQLCPLEEWKELIIKAYDDPSLEDEDREAVGILLESEPRNVWINVIAKVCAHWAYRQKMPPELIMRIFAANLGERYSGVHEGADSPSRLIAKKLRDYES